MLETLFGAFLLSLPFFLLRYFRDTYTGLAFIITGIFGGVFMIGGLTQLFSVFMYPVVFVLYGAVLSGIFFYIKKKKIPSYKIKWKSLDWVLVVLFLLSLYAFYSVHGSYDGLYNVLHTQEYLTAEDFSYIYPYFSDEWYAASFAKKSIENKTLPLVNPFSGENAPFLNFEFAFHSAVSSFFLLLGLNPVTNYIYLSFLTNAFLVVLLYIYAYILTKNRGAALSAGLSLLFVTNGANLPTIWSFIPISLGAFFLFGSLIFLESEKKSAYLMTTFFSLVFYPPLIVFILPIYFVKRFQDKNSYFHVSFYHIGAIIFSAAFVVISAYALKDKNILSAVLGSGMFLFGFLIAIKESFFPHILFKNKFIKNQFLKIPLYYIFLGAIFILPFILNISETKYFLEALKSFLYYKTFTPGAFPQYSPLYIIPTLSLLLFLIGLPDLFKKNKLLLATILEGSFFWGVYAFSLERFIIEYQRVIFVVSVLISAGSAYGVYRIFILLNIPERSLRYIFLFILVASSFFAFQYTKPVTWQRLVLFHKESGQTFLPAAPANKYLTENDLEVFKSIHKAKFLSIPWKGTVIGVATDNYPLSTKPGTITINPELPDEFWVASCEGKKSIAEKFNIEYVYFPPFECRGFNKIAESGEGLILYSISQ
jgi:hypothetical protein